MHAYAKGGSYLETRPAYQNAVRAQQAREAQRQVKSVESDQRRALWQDMKDQADKEERERKERIANFLVRYERGEHTSSKSIITAVAISHGFTHADIVGRSRKHNVVAARQEAVVAVNKKYPMKSLPELGRLFDRDHTTILHFLRKAGVR